MERNNRWSAVWFGRSIDRRTTIGSRSQRVLWIPNNIHIERGTKEILQVCQVEGRLLCILHRRNPEGLKLVYRSQELIILKNCTMVSAS